MDILNLPTQEIATMFNVSHRTVQRWKLKNEIPQNKIKNMSKNFQFGIKITATNATNFSDKNDNDATSDILLSDKIDALTKAIKDLTDAIVENTKAHTENATKTTNAKSDKATFSSENNTLGNSLVCGGKEGGDIGGGDSYDSIESIESLKKEKLKKEKKTKTDYKTDTLFCDFWDKYPHKHAENKKECFKTWQKLSLQTQHLAIERIPNYKAMQGEYTHKAEKYLKQELWETCETVPLKHHIPSQNNGFSNNGVYKSKSDLEHEKGWREAMQDPQYAEIFRNLK